MELYPLGKTNIQISSIGLGCWQFSRGEGLVGRYWPALADETVSDIVQASIEGGVNWFDTAEAYGNGASEAALANALQRLGRSPSDTIIATKWWPAGRTASSILRTFPDRVRYLDGFPITLHQVHQPLGFSSVEREMDAMARLVAEGKIRAVGVSNFNARLMKRAHTALKKHGIALASNQMRYSLLDRRIEKNGVLETAKELGITIIAYSPLEQGLLTGKYRPGSLGLTTLSGVRRRLPAFREGNLKRIEPLLAAIEAVAARCEASPAQVALRWLVGFHGTSVAAIPGASSAQQAASNAAAMNIQLTNEEYRLLDEISRSVSK